MAVSGAGGWIASSLYHLDWKGNLEPIGITQNKPRDCVYSDETQDAVGTIEDAAKLIMAGQSVNVDVRYGQVWKLRELCRSTS